MERCSEIMRVMQQMEIHSCPELMALIQQVGFLPLLDSGVRGYSAEDMVDDDCRYVVFPDGGWDWPLWKWKGPIVTEGNCVYGKFFAGKAGFVSRAWWPDLCNYRRSQHPIPQEGSIEDAYITRLQMACRIVTEDFVYPQDRHGHEYGWGWSLLTTPERLLGREACQCPRTPQESFERMLAHLKKLLPEVSEKQIVKLIK